ncbi:hypothetical protein [Acinetobacter sp. ANC 4218]|uniref:hypothetical protein n=1 Tax=Acinetobacter sp. ANC 4218 TaxID=1977880 RepID=UPI000A32E9B3|nr:hypothetical protein [Acinetobacter sp. ANC 4218]
MLLHLLDRVGPDLESNPLSSPLRVVVAKLIAPVDMDTHILGIGIVSDTPKLWEIELNIFKLVTWSRFKCEQVPQWGEYS